MASEIEEENWRQKYFELLESREKNEKEYQQSFSRLRHQMARISIAGGGIDPKLDRQLKALRRDLTTHVEEHIIQAHVDAISETLKNLDEQKHQNKNQIAEHILRLQEPLKELSIAKELNHQLKEFNQKVKYSHSEDVITLLEDYYVLLFQYLKRIKNIIEPDLPQKRKKPIWQKIFGLNLNHSSPENIPAPPHIITILLRFMTNLSFPPHFSERETAIRNSLSGHLTMETFSNVLDSIASLISEMIHDEHNQFEGFLSQLNQRLEGIYEFFDLAKEREKAKQESTTELNSNLNEEVNGIRQDLNNHTQIEVLQQKVQKRLDTIVENVDTYKETEHRRMQEAIITISEMNSRLNETEETTRQLQEALSTQRIHAQRDNLTRLANRQAYDDHVYKAFAHWQRTKEPVTLVIGDIDHFKQINDQYGHMAGDQVLRMIGRFFSEKTRVTDFVARYGGEEFVLVTIGSEKEAALLIAEKMRRAVAECVFYYQGQEFKTTMSFGVAQFHENDTPELVFERADKALYQAKEKGRNLIEFEAPPEEK